MVGVTLAIAGGLFTLLVSPKRLPPAIYPLAIVVGTATGAGLAIETKYGRGKRQSTAWRLNAPDYQDAVDSTASDFLEDVISEVYSRRAIAGFPRDIPAIAPAEIAPEPEQTPEIPPSQTHENHRSATPAVPRQFTNVLPLDRGNQSKSPVPELPTIPSNIFSGAGEGLSIVGSFDGDGSDDDAWGGDRYASVQQHR